MSAGKDRLGYVDSIRGLAALSVAVFHVLPWSSAPAARTFGTYLDLGKVGVALFFMVSGFVVPFSLNGERANGLRKFVVRRFFRLYPAYWLSILGAVVLLAGAVSASQLLVNVTMLQGFVHVTDILPAFWTLQIELIFYALCAGLFWIRRLQDLPTLRGMSLLWTAVALAMGGLRWKTGIKLPVAVPLALSLMFIGCLWRHYLLDRSMAARSAAINTLAVFILAMPCVALLAYNRDFGFGETWYRYTISYETAALAFLLLTGRWRLENRALVWLGTISYSVYLFHGLILRLYSDAVGPRNNIAWHILAYMAVVLLVSGVVYAVVEKPSIALGRRITRSKNLDGIAVV